MTAPVLPPDPDADAPEWWRRSAVYRRVPIIALIVIVVILVAAQQGTPPPALETDCQHPAFALSTYSVEQHKPVQWSMTGKPGTLYTLVAVLNPQQPGTTATDGANPRTAAPLSQGVTMPSDCTATGTFGVLLPAGTYSVVMAPRLPNGSLDLAAAPRKKLVVTAGSG